MAKLMKSGLVSDYHFELPEQLIAQRPSAQRGESRLMQVSSDGSLSFGLFSQIVDAFQGDELLIVNDARVIPARLLAQKNTGGQVEVFFLEPHEPTGLGLTIRAFTKGRLKIGQTVTFKSNVNATLLARDEQGVATLQLDGVTDLWSWLEQAGQIPLPPYIKRTPDAEDLDRYQTVYAKAPGAVAAPTAGLHFTPSILNALQAKGVKLLSLSLLVGPGTFAPVKVSRIEDHHMHTERYYIPDETKQALTTGRPVIAVGTTVVRALESYAQRPEDDRTDIFITPGYDFQIVDGLITNFHLPQSTLLMLVSAFAGYKLVMESYQRAVQEQMRFYSYGDASLYRRPQGRWNRSY